MKILFIITALCTEVRETVKDEMHGVTYLTEHLDLLLKELRENNLTANVPEELNKLSVIYLLFKILKFIVLSIF